MQIEFDGGVNFITATDARDRVVVRCNTQYTDLRDNEGLEDFIKRHGGADACANALQDFYRAAS